MEPVIVRPYERSEIIATCGRMYKAQCQKWRKYRGLVQGYRPVLL
jgi:hypothetical protein